MITKIIINKLINNLITNKGVGFFLYDFFDLKSLYYLKKFNLNLGFLNINLSKQIYNNFDFNFFYFFNTDLLNLNSYYYYFFLALNLRLKMPLLNSKLRLKLKKSFIKVFSVGFVSSDFSFSMLNLGNTFLNFFKVIENKSKFSLSYFYTSYFLSVFFNIVNTKNMVFLVGENFFYVKNAYKFLLSFCSNFSISNKNLFFLFTNTIDLNYQELNLGKSFNKNIKFYYSFFPFSNNVLKKKKKSFSVLQNSLFVNKLKNFNLILPTVSFFEYNGFFYNFEGRLRKKLKIYSYNNLKLKSNFEILKYFFIILKTFVYFFNFNFKLLKFFSKLVFLGTEAFLKENIIISNFLNIDYNINYNLYLDNIQIFDTIVNVYKFKNIYKTSFVLNKAANYSNTYINTYAI